jgi:CheY-like chemotaxis protein
MARILIAEDEDTLRALCTRALMTEGHDVLTAADGGAALEILTREQGRFDLILTDIRMPVMDGIALALSAARDYPEVCIMLMTGYADQRERAHGLDALIHDVITKPFTLATLRGAVSEALTVCTRE